MILDSELSEIWKKNIRVMPDQIQTIWVTYLNMFFLNKLEYIILSYQSFTQDIGDIQHRHLFVYTFRGGGLEKLTLDTWRKLCVTPKQL